MEHVLDNPAWNALISGNENLSFGEGDLRYFDREVSPFVAFRENTPENFDRLYAILPQNRPCLLPTSTETEIPPQWKVIRIFNGIQMVYDVTKKREAVTAEMILLTDQHVPQMLELTGLTRPGPFEPKTINFGHYYGIFEGEKLVAMAGQRLHVFSYAEISAVCTHPDHTGKGYARQLLLAQIQRIKANNEVPFLHVSGENERAIKVYESVGFSKRLPVWFYAMVKA